MCHHQLSPPPQKAQATSVSPETPEEHQSSEHEASGDEEDKEESDDEGWITLSNLKQVHQNMRHCDTAPDSIQVSCITMDFAMQVGASHCVAWDGSSLKHVGGWQILKTI